MVNSVPIPPLLIHERNVRLGELPKVPPDKTLLGLAVLLRRLLVQALLRRLRVQALLHLQPLVLFVLGLLALATTVADRVVASLALPHLVVHVDLLLRADEGPFDVATATKIDRVFDLEVAQLAERDRGHGFVVDG